MVRSIKVKRENVQMQTEEGKTATQQENFNATELNVYWKTLKWINSQKNKKYTMLQVAQEETKHVDQN